MHIVLSISISWHIQDTSDGPKQAGVLLLFEQEDHYAHAVPEGDSPVKCWHRKRLQCGSQRPFAAFATLLRVGPRCRSQQSMRLERVSLRILLRHVEIHRLVQLKAVFLCMGQQGSLFKTNTRAWSLPPSLSLAELVWHTEDPDRCVPGRDAGKYQAACELLHNLLSLPDQWPSVTSGCAGCTPG